MRDFRLTSRQRQRLRAALKSVEDAHVVTRIVALLQLDQGAPLSEVATSVGMTRQTLYNWVRRFEAGGGLRALVDRTRQGRPPKLSRAVQRLLVWLLKQPPDAFGYAAVGWTTPCELKSCLALWCHPATTVIWRNGSGQACS